MFVARDFKRTEKDDFILNIKHLLDKYTEAIPFYRSGVILGWKIQSRFE